MSFESRLTEWRIKKDISNGCFIVLVIQLGVNLHPPYFQDKGERGSVLKRHFLGMHLIVIIYFSVPKYPPKREKRWQRNGKWPWNEVWAGILTKYLANWTIQVVATQQQKNNTRITSNYFYDLSIFRQGSKGIRQYQINWFTSPIMKQLVVETFEYLTFKNQLIKIQLNSPNK